MTHLLTDFNYKFHITILQILQQFYFRFMRHVYNIFQQNFEFNEIEIWVKHIKYWLEDMIPKQLPLWVQWVGFLSLKKPQIEITEN